MKKLFTILLSALMVFPALAQSDFGGDLSVSLSKKWGKFNAALDEELRLQDNFSKWERGATSLSVSYKALPFLKLGAIYDLMYSQYEKKDKWKQELRQRASLYVSGDVDAGRWNFQLRERYQATFRQSKDWQSPKQYLRSRFKAAYDLPHSAFEPYASVEMYYTLFPAKVADEGINRWRYTAGCEYRLNKKNSLEAYYRFTQYVTDDKDDADGHLLGVSFAHKF